MTDKTDDKIEELKSATRAANEALKEIKSTLREVSKVRDEIKGYLEHVFDEKVAAMVATKLDEYQASMDKAIEDGTNAVFKRFDDLTAIALGETKGYRKQHDQTIPEILFKQRTCSRCGGINTCDEICVGPPLHPGGVVKKDNW